MNARKIADAVRSVAPEELSLRAIAQFGCYDNTGLLLDSGGDREIRSVLVALDADRRVLCEAREGNYEMVVSHHPVLYRPVRELTADGEQGVIAGFLAAGIPVYSAHLSLDAARDGINRTLADLLGVRNPVPVEDLGEGQGFGFYGAFDGTLADLAEEVCRLTGSPARVSENLPSCRCVCISNGAGADPEFLAKARRAGCDTVVSGDVAHHAFVWAVNNGLNLVDAGHFETEHFFMQTFAERLSARCPDVRFDVSASGAPYYYVTNRRN